MKQLKISKGGGYSKDEKEQFRSSIIDNVIDSMKLILEYAENNNVEITPEEDAKHAMEVSMYTREKKVNSIPKDIAEGIAKLWANPIILGLAKKGAEYSLQDTHDHFLSRALKIAEATYEITNDDVLLVRAPTTQISEIPMTVDGQQFRFYDVAGQRMFRKAWIPYFDNSTVVLFIASLASYDQKLIEDERVNRMKDALKLFKFIGNHPLLATSGLIMFLNKKDLFQKKIQKSKLSVHFTDYTGDNSEQDASNWIMQKFAVQLTPDRDPIIHLTTCTDSKAMGVIVSSVITTTLQRVLKSSSII